MDISQEMQRRDQTKKQPYHSSQLQPEKFDYLADYYHVNNKEKPLCNQNRQLIYLCSKEDFKALPPSMKCKRCQWLIGYI